MLAARYSCSDVEALVTGTLGVDRLPRNLEQVGELADGEQTRKRHPSHLDR
jgi:hypothetical protein